MWSPCLQLCVEGVRYSKSLGNSRLDAGILKNVLNGKNFGEETAYHPTISRYFLFLIVTARHTTNFSQKIFQNVFFFFFVLLLLKISC
jgi:predicted Na+-dependent transporter